MVNISVFIDVNARYWPRKAVAVFPDRGKQYTYPELLSEINRFSNALRSLGVRRGDRVAIYMPNAPETLIAFLGTWRAGAVAVPMNVVLRDYEVRHLLNDSGASVVVTNSQGYEVIRNLRGSVPEVSVILTDGGASGDGVHSWADLMASSRDSGRAENCKPECLAQLQYTSGTTGLPKGAMLTHCNWIAAFDSERWALGLTDRDVMLYIYPMVHVGFSWALTALKYGATVIFMERYSMEKYLRYAAEYGATVLCSMPPVMTDMVNGPSGIEEYFRTARVVVTGGAPTPEPIWEEVGIALRHPSAQRLRPLGDDSSGVRPRHGAGVGAPEQGLQIRRRPHRVRRGEDSGPGRSLEGAGPRGDRRDSPEGAGGGQGLLEERGGHA
jgi:Acyl-CoA synthetases (AMP-forming)/AMP-acid ligases II